MTLPKILPSVSFCGAGFLGCYHIGVASCLLRHGYILPPGETSSEKTPMVLGASAGALTCAVIAAGVTPEDSMQIVIQLAHETKQKGGVLDSFRPGFSLIDQVEKVLFPALNHALDGDEELLQRRIQSPHGKSLLRIALTDRNDLFSSTSSQDTPMKAYRYTDTYRNIQDLCAASILSSYIPGITGPWKGSKCPANGAVHRSWNQMKEMISLGFVKDGLSHQIIQNEDSIKNDSPNKEIYWDGGIANMWPILNNDTLVVSCLVGNFAPNPFISPKDPYLESKYMDNSWRNRPLLVPMTDRAKISVDRDNAKTLFKMCISSDDSFLEERFRDGYDDANRFLSENNLLKVFS